MPEFKPEFAVLPVDSLVPFARNPRRHPPEAIEAVKRSVEHFGWTNPLIVRKTDRLILAGHARLEVAQARGMKDVPCVLVDMNDEDAAAYVIADNQTVLLSQWDEEALRGILTELGPERSALTGFSAEDMARILGTDLAGGLTDPDEIPEPPDEATTRLGDLWLLGDHRLLCGDAGKAEDVDRLLDGGSVHLASTDPPYNVRVEPRSNNAIAAGLSSFGEPGLLNHQGFDVARQGRKKATSKKLRPKDRPLANDFVSDEAFEKMLHAWFGNMARVLAPGHGFYIWGGYANCGNYPPVLKAVGLYFSQAIIWDKQHPVLTRKDFMGAHEWCFYGWKEGAAHRFFGPPNVPDLWPVKKVNPASMIHLTEKPVELSVRALQYSSLPNENVLDLFGGSGSTLIAAQQTGRRAFLMELDRLYADVIVQRWENFTGRKAERVAASCEKLGASL